MRKASDPPPGIGVLDWAGTPQAVRILVIALQHQIGMLSEQVGALSERVMVLEERGRQSSRNTSKPPSSDPPSLSPWPGRTPSGRARGGQPGHVGHGRPLVPEEQVDEVVESKPSCCARCGLALVGEDPAPGRHQVQELPRLVPVVREYRRHTLRCGACGTRTVAPWPVGMPTGGFGPRVAATVGYLTGRCGASHRETQEILGTLCHLEVGLGGIAALQRQVSAAVAVPVAEAHASVQVQRVANVDETGWREQTRRCWRWVAVTALVSVFLVRPTRGSRGARDLVGDDFAGIVGSDRWSGYTWLATGQRQLCRAHLVRDFEALRERPGAGPLGTALLDLADRLFVSW